jgi:membrane fusion protein
MSELLFRREALDARRGSWLGGISLALWVLTGFAGLAALAIGLFLTFGPYTRRSAVTGQLVPGKGLATVMSPTTGVIAQLETAEGDHLRAGQRLAVVTVPRTTPEGGDTQAALAARIDQRRDGLVSLQTAQQAQLQAQVDGLRAQLATARRELVQIEAEVGTRQEQARIARETLARLKQLEDNRYVSLLQIKQQESAALDYAGQVQALERQAISARCGIAQLEQALHGLPGQEQAMQAALQRDIVQLETERVQAQAQGALAISAPVTGVIATQLVKPGQSVRSLPLSRRHS